MPVAVAQEGERPKCNARLAGQLWPADANQDEASFAKHSRCGDLEICARGILRYRWQTLTVRFDQLRKNGELHKPAGCGADSDMDGRNRSAQPQVQRPTDSR